MRTSAAMLYKNYLKKSDEPNDEDETPKTIQQTTTSKTVIEYIVDSVSDYPREY